MKISIILFREFNIRLLLIFTVFIIICPSMHFAQPAYDLKVEKPVAIAPYKIWQKDQVYGFGGMANVKNLGTKPPVNQKTKLDIYDGNSTLVWSDSIVNNGINEPMTGKFIPNGSGTYKGVYTVTQDSSDFNFTDNKVEFDFEINDSIMAKENVGKLGKGINSGSPLYWGNIYHITNDKSESGEPLYCNQVQIGIGNAKVLAYNHGYIFVNLLKWNNINNNEIIEYNEFVVVGKSYYIFKLDDPYNEIFTLRLNDFNTNKHGVKLEANTTYIVEFEYSNPLISDNCVVLADPGLDYSLTTLRDSIKNESNYGHQMIWDYKKKAFALGTYENAVPVFRMVLGSKIEKSYVGGKVFLDFDCDSIFNNKDELLTNHEIIDNSLGVPISKTNNLGVYVIELDSIGIYEYMPLLIAGMKSNPESYIIKNDSLNKEFTNRDFALCFTNSFHDLEAILSPYNPPRPGFHNKYDVCIKNKGSYSETAQLVMDFQDLNADIYTDISQAYGGNIVDHTITWNINNLKYLDEVCYNVELKVHNNTPLGTIFTPRLKILYDSSTLDITPFNNEVNENQVVVGSFDPNDKTVNKSEFIMDQLKSGVELDYTIRFQNTGNAWAEFIEVFDTIKYPLDITRFEMLSASHNYTVDIINDSIIKWRFDDINLPSSLTLEDDSHGYIKFRIHSKENLTPQDVISNSAAIYFDFNPPVFTDPAITKFADLTSVHSLNKENLQLNIFPNPTNDKATLQFDLPKKMDCKIEIRDVSGKLIQANKLRGRSKGLNEELLDLYNFNSGVYLIRILTNELSGELRIVKE